ncbi:MAG: hypothetical protein AB3X44_06230 [Leptothrix sp. (in: b-proteobacteria)]
MSIQGNSGNTSLSTENRVACSRFLCGMEMPRDSFGTAINLMCDGAWLPCVVLASAFAVAAAQPGSARLSG